MNNQLKTCILLLVLFSCNSGSEKKLNEKAVSVNQPLRDVDLIKKEVFDGNVKSYNELKVVFLDYPPESFLYWSFLMAHKHDYPEAYLDVFYSLLDAYVGNIEKFDEIDHKTQNLMLGYLEEASDRGVNEAKELYDLLKKFRSR